jgi:hypothetical protein
MHATCLSNFIPLYLILIIFGEGHKLWSYSLCIFLQPRTISTFFSPNIFLSTLFSNVLSLCSSLNIRGQVYLPPLTLLALSSVRRDAKG